MAFRSASILIDDRTETERRIDAILSKLQRSQSARVAKELEDKDFLPPLLLRALAVETTLALTGPLAAAYLNQATAMDEAISDGLYREVLEREAQAWAAQYAERLGDQVTRAAVERMLDKLRSETEVVPRADIAPERIRELADEVFSPGRAESIAYTETTRAASAGGLNYADRVRLLGSGNVRMIWVTAKDDRVCWICKPLDGKDQDTWRVALNYIDGPPAHPRCRCSLRYEVAVEQPGGVVV